MDKFEIVKNAICEIKEKYLYSFDWSFDITWNNLFINVSQKLLNENLSDHEIMFICNSIFYFLKREIFTYVTSRLENTNIEKVIEQIKNENKKVFDDQFLDEIKVRRENGYAISPIENRLEELLLDKIEM